MICAATIGRTRGGWEEGWTGGVTEVAIDQHRTGVREEGTIALIILFIIVVYFISTIFMKK